MTRSKKYVGIAIQVYAIAMFLLSLRNYAASSIINRNGRRDRTSFETNSICYHNSRGIDPDSDSLVEKRKFNNNCSDMDGSIIVSKLCYVSSGKYQCAVIAAAHYR